MKNLICLSFILLLIAFVFQNCSREEEVVREGKLQFMVNLNSAADPGARNASDLPAGSSLRVSIETSSGAEVYTLHPVSLYKAGNEFISEPLSLNPGTYKVTDFLVISPDSEVLYATPKTGSDLASLVQHPLPVTFSIQKNSTANLDLQVVDVSHHAPEDFGYVSFGVDIVHPTLPVSVFTMSEEGAQLATAEAFILINDDTVQSYSLDASVNQLPFPENVDTEFTLVVIKDSYARHHEVFPSFKDLLIELEGRPLSVTLRPAFTMGIEANASYGLVFGSPYFWMRGDEEFLLSIDWGDGTPVQEFTARGNGEPISGFYLNHTFKRHGTYFVSITGELNRIIGIDLFSPYNRIGLAPLVNLETFISQWVETPEIMDFSNNHEIDSVALGLTNIKELVLSDHPKLKYLKLQGSDMSTEGVDKLIDDVYATIVAHNNKHGILNISDSEVPYGEHTGMLGPPSPDRIKKLLSMINEYNWEVSGFLQGHIKSYVDHASSPGLTWHIGLQNNVYEPVSFYIDWGDGSPTESVVTSTSSLSLQHTYASPGEYIVYLIGDVPKIRELHLDPYNDIYLHQLTGLFLINHTFTGFGPAVLDLSDNSNLTQIMVNGSTIESIRLGANEILGIKTMEVSGTKLGADELNGLIETIYSYRKYNGTFELLKEIDNPSSGFVAEVTPENIERLRELRDVYHWTIPGLP